MTRIVSVALQKGGVGKTTSTVNLAGALAGHYGLNTLVIDFDGQTNATSTLLGRQFDSRGDIWTVLYSGASIEETMLQAPQHPKLFVLPGSPELAYWEKKLSEDQWDALVFESRRILRERIPEGIDVILIDTPPSLGLWLQIAIAASDGVILVVQPHEYSADGIRDLMRTVHAIQEKVNPDLVIDGLIINGVRPTTGEHTAWVEEYRKQFGAVVLEPPLLERIVLAEAQRLKTPIEFYPGRGASEARGWFRDIAGELVRRTGITPAHVGIVGGTGDGRAETSTGSVEPAGATGSAGTKQTAMVETAIQASTETTAVTPERRARVGRTPTPTADGSGETLAGAPDAGSAVPQERARRRRSPRPTTPGGR